MKSLLIKDTTIPPQKSALKSSRHSFPPAVPTVKASTWTTSTTTTSSVSKSSPTSTANLARSMQAAFELIIRIDLKRVCLQSRSATTSPQSLCKIGCTQAPMLCTADFDFSQKLKSYFTMTLTISFPIFTR